MIRINKNANVLIVDDSKTHTQLIKKSLEQEGHNIFFSYDGLNLVDIITENKINVILLDIILPKKDGFEILQELLEIDETHEIPIIMLTGLTTSANVKKALDMGAFDYIKKPVDPLEIVARVHSALRLSAKQDLLRQYAIKDNLTLLYNRAYADKMLQKALKSGAAYPKGLCFTMLDIDYFKKVNDNFGHICGDLVLSAVGDQLSKSIRGSDIACRFGGEEFCILFLNTSLMEGIRISERICRSIGKIVIHFKGNDIKVTISAGVTHIGQNYDQTSYLKFIHQADQALYLAKSKGRNRVEVFPAAL